MVAELYIITNSTLPVLCRYPHNTGPEWSYAGSGPAQLALALLADALGDDKQAERLYQDFKFKVVGRLPHDGWTLTDQEIRQKLRDIRRTTRSRAGGDA